MLDKGMLLSWHRVLVATVRRAPSDLFFSRAKLRSERSKNSEERVGLWEVAANSGNTPRICTARRTAKARPQDLAASGQGLHGPPVQTVTLEPAVKLSMRRCE